ncbi:S8 family serine peptidase [Limibacter armeniacum]|uniref:S8 family serine peptidase n=1 Tax=Limibacter armeniacum TaxID=466084 RepID=UPI002FE6AFA9
MILQLYSISVALAQVYTTERIIVKIKPEVDSNNWQTFIASNASHPQSRSICKPLTFNAENQVYTIDGLTSSFCQELYQSGMVDYIEMDHWGTVTASHEAMLPNDPGFSDQWYLHNDGNSALYPVKAGADINVEEAWEYTQGDTSVVVAILDTGINPSNPDFEGRIWQNKKELPNGLDDDGNGLVDDIWGWDFHNNDNEPTDNSGHGSMVAGIIGANGNNGQGFSGIDWHCKLMICQVIDSKEGGFYSNWIRGIYYAVENEADIINLSVAGNTDSKALEEAIRYAVSRGVLVVSSMGNDNVETPAYPSAYSEVLAVGATNPDDTRSIAFSGDLTKGSNYGTHLDIMAPGNYIRGLNHTDDLLPVKVWSGTSMAAPMVSGAAALLKAYYPNLTPQEIMAFIKHTAVDQVGNPAEDQKGRDNYYGYGRLDAGKLLKAVDNKLKLPIEGLTVAPNPVSDLMTFSLRLDSESPLMWQLIDMEGRKLRSGETVASAVFSKQLSLQGLVSGIYILKVSTIRKTYYCKLLRK